MLIASRGPAGVYGDGCVDHLWLHSIHEGYPIGMAQYVKGTHSCGICAKWRKQGLLETKIHAINDALIKEELEEGLDGYYDEVA
jgi:hypothetical protein